MATVLHLTWAAVTIGEEDNGDETKFQESQFTIYPGLATSLKFLGKHSPCCPGLDYNVSKARIVTITRAHPYTPSLACEIVNLRLDTKFIVIQSPPVCPCSSVRNTFWKSLIWSVQGETRWRNWLFSTSLLFEREPTQCKSNLKSFARTV